jgi:hypothetical protein
MTSPELDREFYAALGGMELGATGIREYEDVTMDTRGLQDSLIDYMLTLGEFNPEDETAMSHTMFYLKNLLDQDFARLRTLDYDDEIIASGAAVVMAVDEKGNVGFETLCDEVRLHGTIRGPHVINVPFIDSAELAEVTAADILERQPIPQISAALEIENASFEVIDPDSAEGTFDNVDPDHRIFLALVYPELKIKRRA